MIELASETERDWDADELMSQHFAAVGGLMVNWQWIAAAYEGWPAALAERRRLLALLADRHAEATSVVAALNEKIEGLLARIERRDRMLATYRAAASSLTAAIDGRPEDPSDEVERLLLTLAGLGWSATTEGARAGGYVFTDPSGGPGGPAVLTEGQMRHAVGGLPEGCATMVAGCHVERVGDRYRVGHAGGPEPRPALDAPAAVAEVIRAGLESGRLARR